MSKLFIFNMVTVDGFFEGANHDISWHNVDAEFNEFAIKQLDEVNSLVFGRKTYELMASYWPTAEAKQDDPQVAQKMNDINKIVVTSTLTDITWQNSVVINEDIKSKIQELKESNGTVGVFGSGKLSNYLLNEGLVDEIRLMVNPVVIGEGTPMFSAVENRINLTLTESIKFNSGNILMKYEVKK